MTNKTAPHGLYKGTTPKTKAANESRVELWIRQDVVKWLTDRFPDDSLESSIFKAIAEARHHATHPQRQNQALTNARNEADQLRAHIALLQSQLDGERAYVKALHKQIHDSGFQLIFED